METGGRSIFTDTIDWWIYNTLIFYKNTGAYSSGHGDLRWVLYVCYERDTRCRRWHAGKLWVEIRDRYIDGVLHGRGVKHRHKLKKAVRNREEIRRALNTNGTLRHDGNRRWSVGLLEGDQRDGMKWFGVNRKVLSNQSQFVNVSAFGREDDGSWKKERWWKFWNYKNCAGIDFWINGKLSKPVFQGCADGVMDPLFSVTLQFRKNDTENMPRRRSGGETK